MGFSLLNELISVFRMDCDLNCLRNLTFSLIKSHFIRYFYAFIHLFYFFILFFFATQDIKIIFLFRYYRS